uniref:LRC2 n=1 Tax=Griffithsia pacifica TaxID=35689 RepID=A0A291FEB7_GRIPA|nr:LRC2 [Griffithsia pacifica]5Y6P_B2 Chain B2, LRC2 [Griffithsia pacifica]5Y6P_b3 Chain b3, LRC2 [Griffithsia pacifica]
MVAFVAPTPSVASSATRFATGTTRLTNDANVPSVAATRRSAHAPPSMRVLDGLDTVTQDSYSFSRYVLGPFQPSVLNANSSEYEREIAIRAAYRHVFGNAYIMEEELAEVEVTASQYKLGNLTAKEFIRALAKSSAYKTRFFEGASQYRFVELNFMHLLGRAPDTQEEVATHMNIYHAKGFDAEIDSYIDSEEYDSVFGDYNVPFLRFRGAYTPCDSFNKQCALKGGWANSDKAMGGAALSGYNGSDGRQMCDRISAYVTSDTTDYESVAGNSPLLTTSPNWLAYPDPAIAPTPAFISPQEVREARARVEKLREAYNEEIAKTQARKNAMAPFRAMVEDMAPMLDRGVTFGDPMLVHPEAKLPENESALADLGGKSSDYKRFWSTMETNTVSRLERDLEEAKAELRVLEKGVDALTPMSTSVELRSASQDVNVGLDKEEEAIARPRIATKPRVKKVVDATEKRSLNLPGGIKINLPF